MKEDKIFNNNYHDPEFNEESINFKVDNNFFHTNNQLDEAMDKHLEEKIHYAIEDSQWAFLNEIDGNGQFPVPTKEQMNYVFDHIIKNVDDEDIIDLYSATAEYFGINSKRFYNALSNYYKDLLVTSLKKNTYYLKNKIKRLF